MIAVTAAFSPVTTARSRTIADGDSAPRSECEEGLRPLMRLSLLIAFLIAAPRFFAATEETVIDQTARISSTCELHHVQMVKTRVSLHCSGIAAPYHHYSTCPHTKRPIDTGCMRVNGYGYIWVCSKCD